MDCDFIFGLMGTILDLAKHSSKRRSRRDQILVTSDEIGGLRMQPPREP